MQTQKRKHIRLRNYDYSSKGWYFITICTHERNCYLGKIEDKSWVPSAIGKQANTFWNEIPNHFTNIKLGEYVIMPNHIHGIIGIVQTPHVGSGHDLPLANTHTHTDVGPRHGVANNHMANNGLFPQDLSSNEMAAPWEQNKFGKTTSGSLSAIVGQFKSSLTRWCHMNKYAFGWQSRFYDHVIRDEKEFERIRNYIINNISNWEMDKFNLE